MRIPIKSLVLALFGAASALAAQGPALGMLAKLPRGQWTITPRDGSPARSICLGDAGQLVQLRHADSANCSRLLVDDAPDKLTVQYTCRGSGYGRTSIRRETDTLLQIESQGVRGGLPFQFTAEARRTGACRKTPLG